MKMTINTRILLDTLKIIGRAVPRKTVLPATEDFLFKTEKDKPYLILAATNGDTFLSTAVPVPGIEKEKAAFLAPAALLLELLGQIDDKEDIKLELQGERLSVSWSNGNAKFPVFDETDWPLNTQPEYAESQITKLVLTPEKVANILEHTLDATETNTAIPALSSILFDIRRDGTGNAVASDRSIMAVYPLGADAEADAQILLPTDPARILTGVIRNAIRKDSKRENNDTAEQGADSQPAQVTIISDGRRIRLLVGNYEMTTSATREKFPAYEKIMPKEGETPLSVTRAEFMDSINRSCSIMGKSSAILVINLSGNTMRTVVTDEYAKSRVSESLDFCDYAGDDLEIAMNCGRLLELLGMFDSEKVRFDFNGARKPVLVSAADTDEEPLRAVIMPVPVPVQTKP